MSLGYVNEIAYFVDCFINDRQPQAGTRGIDGLNALAVTFAIYESAENGKMIEVPRT